MQRPDPDTLRQLAKDVLAGFGLLTRIPVPFQRPRPAAAWAWPLVGLGVAGVAVAAGAAASALGLAAGPAAALVLGVQAALTGGLHEDGLADCADGFFGGHSPERRLEIMKDSHIGSFGALALSLVVLARWSGLVVLISAGSWGVVLAAGAISRAPMAALMAGLPNARGAGLSAMVGAPSRVAAGVASALALAIGLALAGPGGLVMALAAGLGTIGLAFVAKAKIGGQTGDVLGAGQQIGETLALCVLAQSSH